MWLMTFNTFMVIILFVNYNGIIIIIIRVIMNLELRPIYNETWA